MPSDQNSSQNRRPHYHRGRRGGDRRGSERRNLPAAAETSHRDNVDVEQIMRDIRSRISSRHGIDLSAQQIQELAARRLEAILEPRHMKPALLEQMRRAAGERIEVPAATVDTEPPFDESKLYESHRGIVATLRRLLNPLLKLMFNPAPIAEALTAQAIRNNAAAQREAELYARQAEWNALHYEILQRLVTENARGAIEVQTLLYRMEALEAKLDFNERRVRGMELSSHQSRPAPRPVEPPAPEAAAPSSGTGMTGAVTTETTDGARRRRRRRRGRRSGPPGAEGTGPAEPNGRTGSEADGDGDVDGDEIDSPEITVPRQESVERAQVERAQVERAQVEQEQVERESVERARAGREGAETGALEPAHHFSLLQPAERYPSGDAVASSSPSATPQSTPDETGESVRPAASFDPGDPGDPDRR